MGQQTEGNTHEQQSSGMSFGEGWKHGKVRLFSLIFGLSIAFLFMFTVLLYGTSLKTVTIVVDGKIQVVETRATTWQHLLDEQAVTIGKHDQLSAELPSPMKQGDILSITRGNEVRVVVKGKTKKFVTTERTVGNALAAADIKVDGDDKLVPSANTAIVPGMQVKVVEVKKMVVEQKKTVPFDVVKKKDSALALGKQKTIAKGQNGEILKKFEKVFEDGVMVDMNVIDEKIVAVKKNRIVAIGTRKPVRVLSYRPNEEEDDNAAETTPADDNTITRGGFAFTPKKVLNNVTLTAYSADFASTGKTKSHKYYGVTASGTRVGEGRTIAVDTRIIPFGYWVYIEGVGLRRAEDRGSAIKGNKIDVYVPTQREALQFGRKRGHTVYVIGPNKPAER